MPYVLLALLSLLWGTSFLLIKIATRAFDPYAFAFLRVTIGALVLGAFAASLRASWPRGAIWMRLAAMSLFGQIAPFLLAGAAARLTTSADLALMMGAAPVLTFALSPLFGAGGGWSLRAVAGVALGFCGVAICIGAPALATPTAGAGRILGLLAAAGYATGALMSREASRQVGATMAATASMALSSVVLFALWLVKDGAPTLDALAHPPLDSTLAILALGAFNTALAYVLYFRLVVTAGATFAAMNNYVVPFIGLLFGAALLGEPIAMAAWIGSAFVIGGVALTGVGGAPRAATLRA